MDWSKIKTIFIISFLILDIYLVYEFFKIQVTNEYEIQTEAPIDKWLKADEIKYESLPTGYVEEYYLKARPKVFTKKDIEKPILSDQTINIISDTLLESVLNKPIKIKEKFEPSDLSSLIKAHILYGDQYRFWKKDNESRTITYYQQYKGKSFYQNINGELKFKFNEDNEIISYEQTFLSEIKEMSESEKIIQPIKALETLYRGGYLEPKSMITEVELGYYTLVPLSDTTQVLNPAWCFVINDEERLFVSAFEGKVVDLDPKENNVVE
nr:two-component system regulatory protein YycI [uncultured Bacillus sp.]